MDNEDKKLSSKDFFDMSEVGKYFFRKKGDQPKADFNLKAMHVINKLSIIIFLAAVVYLIVKNVILWINVYS